MKKIFLITVLMLIKLKAHAAVFSHCTEGTADQNYLENFAVLNRGESVTIQSDYGLFSLRILTVTPKYEPMIYIDEAAMNPNMNYILEINNYKEKVYFNLGQFVTLPSQVRVRALSAMLYEISFKGAINLTLDERNQMPVEIQNFFNVKLNQAGNVEDVCSAGY
jgi:hypothetical protein